MQKTILNTLFLIFVAGTASGQMMTRTAPATPGSTPANGGNPVKKSAPPELVGLTGQPAPAFTHVSLGGAEHSLEKLRGKVVVLNLWGTFCEPCVTEMPKLNALVEKYRGRDVVFLAASPEDKTLLSTFLLSHPFDYEILPDAMSTLRAYSPKKKTPSANDRPGGFIMALPAHLVIDREGSVVAHSWGYKPTVTEDLSQVIDKLLADKPAAAAAAKN